MHFGADTPLAGVALRACAGSFAPSVRLCGSLRMQREGGWKPKIPSSLMNSGNYTRKNFAGEKSRDPSPRGANTSQNPLSAYRHYLESLLRDWLSPPRSHLFFNIRSFLRDDRSVYCNPTATKQTPPGDECLILNENKTSVPYLPEKTLRNRAPASEGLRARGWPASVTSIEFHSRPE